MVACQYEELWAKLGPINVLSCVDKKEGLVQAREFLAEFLPQWLKPLEKILATGGSAGYSGNERILARATKGNEWYSGDSPTFADFAIMVILDFVHRDYMTFKGLNNLEERRSILDQFPLVKANYERTSSLPAVLSWKNKKPKFAGL